MLVSDEKRKMLEMLLGGNAPSPAAPQQAMPMRPQMQESQMPVDPRVAAMEAFQKQGMDRGMVIDPRQVSGMGGAPPDLPPEYQPSPWDTGAVPPTQNAPLPHSDTMNDPRLDRNSEDLPLDRNPEDQPSTEEELAGVQKQINTSGQDDGTTPWDDADPSTDTPTDKDTQFLRDNPTDGNIQSFIDTFGEDALPDDMKNPDPEAPDYLGSGPRDDNTLQPRPRSIERKL